jgi:ABC-type antimicrobial peptide transport system, permease component
MKSLGKINAELRRRNLRHYALLAGCIFFSVLLITAYASMMRSPTVLAILPEGGDSRRQVMMIFVLAVVGCGVFTTYAASLFFRYKSRETGILMLLGASRGQLRRQLFKELALISTGSCLIGALLGTPLAWCVWQLFQIFSADTQETALSFDPQAYRYALAFSLFILAVLFLMSVRFIRRTNLIDIVNEQRKSEPVRDVKPWFGPVGIALMIVGGFGGYITPDIFVKMLRRYPPVWANITYLPLFAGLYMALIHTVMRGWRRGKSRYKNMIVHSMMKFQGRQTVNNMLVLTVLIAGAYFSAFYSPMLGTGAVQETEKRPVDYAFHYRADQSLPTRSEIEAMASGDGVAVTDWRDTESAVLGHDGNREIDEENGKFHYEYQELLGESNYLSESSFNKMTGQTADIRPGRFAPVVAEESSGDMEQDGKSLLTNMTTKGTLHLGFQQFLRFDMLASAYYVSYYVLDDADYAKITAGLSDEWREKLVYFNVKDALTTYSFAKQLFNTIVDRSGPECEVSKRYDRIEKATAKEDGETYWGDEHPETTKVNYAQPDSTVFRMNWKYMPRFRVLDRYDFTIEYAVFFMVFLFISIVCFAAVLVIGYTRCLTIAMNHRQVYDDLRHLGAAPQYLCRSVKGQISKVFGVPGLVGTVLICAFYSMILFFNDNRITQSEISGLISCSFVVAGMSAVLWAFYRFTLHRVCGMLHIKQSKKPEFF